MKKIKFLPSVLMLVLSIAVLGLGVYAANPSTNTVTGSIKVNASSYPIAIRCLLDGEEIENHQTIRAGITWTDGLSNLEFNTDTALTVEDVDDRVITLEVTNLSNINLGAYFLTDDDTLTAENKATLDSISTVEHLESGTDTVVKATKTGYTKLEPGATAEMTITMELYKFFFEEVNVGFSYVLNVEECQDSLVTMEQGITVNTNGISMDNLTITPSVNHGYTVETGMVVEANSGRYATTNLAIDDDNYINSYMSLYKRYRTTDVRFAITNNGTYGISADINAVLEEEKIQITTLGNAYIGPGETGEVSLQFTPLREGTETITATINDVFGNINVYKATTEVVAESDIYSRIKYNEDGYNGGTMNHYIEYGVNPFKPTEKLKWYIWGVKVGDSDLRAISDEDVVDGNKLIRSTTELPREYYFISENVLDVSGANYPYLVRNNEHDHGGYENADSTSENRYFASKYEGSLLEGYLSGTTMRTDYINISSSWPDVYISSGSIANFYDYYKLKNDPIYNQINGRLLSELHSSDSNANDGGFNDEYEGVVDKFWALSFTEEYFNILGAKSEISVAKLLSTKVASYWWTRSIPNDNHPGLYVTPDGDFGYTDVCVDNVGVRPAFKLAI